MRTTMLPLVNIAAGDWPLTDQPVDTLFASITDVFDFYSRNLATSSGHALIIEETGRRLNPETILLLKNTAPWWTKSGTQGYIKSWKSDPAKPSKDLLRFLVTC